MPLVNKLEWMLSVCSVMLTCYCFPIMHIFALNPWKSRCHEIVWWSGQDDRITRFVLVFTSHVSCRACIKCYDFKSYLCHFEQRTRSIDVSMCHIVTDIALINPCQQAVSLYQVIPYIVSHIDTYKNYLWTGLLFVRHKKTSSWYCPLIFRSVCLLSEITWARF